MKITITWNKDRREFIAKAEDIAEDGTKLSKEINIEDEASRTLTVNELYDYLLNILLDIYLNLKSPLM